jgi:hypothetical protein
MSNRASGNGGLHHRGHRAHRGGTEENQVLVVRAHGASIKNDMTVLGFLCATSVILLSSVVKNTARTGTPPELENQK